MFNLFHSFSNFPLAARNRAANYLPGLGYNVATALYIIFCLRYNCPGCGTPVKLFGKHRGRHIHH